VGLSLKAADALARRYGCFLRVMRRDGHALTGDANWGTNRVDVATCDDVVSEVFGQ
jgi:hypothetical protein